VEAAEQFVAETDKEIAPHLVVRPKEELRGGVAEDEEGLDREPVERDKEPDARDKEPDAQDEEESAEDVEVVVVAPPRRSLPPTKTSWTKSWTPS